MPETTPAPRIPEDVAAVVIGRNEGDRLVACLDSLAGQVSRIVYVDSGSTDGSVAAATVRDVATVSLDLSVPFTAARARNAGVARLAEERLPAFVQFVDGDCTLRPGWIDAARAAFDGADDLGIVTGWRTERDPAASVYARMAEHEWRRAAGEIEACGGDMMVRTEVLADTGGFDDRVIAAEDDEFCLRVRAGGWRIRRLAQEMTEHDLAMTTFRQWWKRAERAGHGFAQVGALHRGYFSDARRRVFAYGLVLPAMLLVAAASQAWGLVAAALAVYTLSYARTVQGLRRDGAELAEALTHAAYLTLSKFPNVLGMARFYWRQTVGRRMELIEYK